LRFAVLVSGSGTNLAALIAAEAAGELAPGEIALVISNRPGVRAIERAEAAGKDVAVIDHTSFASRADFEQALLDRLSATSIDAVILAGFMRILTSRFVGAFPHRIINTHPALCPSFPGINAPAQAVEYGVRITGCTVHFVDDGVDTGPIIDQRSVAVLEDDDADSLHKRIQKEEHELLPLAARLLAQGRLRVSGRRVRIAGESGAD